MRIGLFGGRFDPPHIGHLLAAQGALEALDLDRVLFIPAQTPPHKSATAAAEARFEMVVVATASHPQFRVSRVEIDRFGPSYTFDTVMEFRGKQPRDELFFLTGLDAYADVSTWHRATELVEEVKMVAVSRPGYSLEGLEPPFREKVQELATVACGVSSTDIRRRLGEGRPIRYLVPEPVESYLDKHDLYRKQSLQQS